jgi:hypothetical protein
VAGWLLMPWPVVGEIQSHMSTTRLPIRTPSRQGERCRSRHQWLRVLVVVDVAQRRLGPSSSATTSTVDRAAILGGPGQLLEPAHHHHSAAAAYDESHLIRDRLKPPESVSAQSARLLT